MFDRDMCKNELRRICSHLERISPSKRKEIIFEIGHLIHYDVYPKIRYYGYPKQIKEYLGLDYWTFKDEWDKDKKDTSHRVARAVNILER